MYCITNIYVLAAFGTIGGALFGFDIRYGTRLALLSADADPSAQFYERMDRHPPVSRIL